MIEEMVQTKASPKKVWQAWAEHHRWTAADEKGKNAFQVGKTGHVIEKGKRKASYEIMDIEPNKSFTTLWRAFLVKMTFTYRVEKTSKGSAIYCQIGFKGILAPVVRFFLKNKMKKMIGKSLRQFAWQVENS